jgi:2-haloacid dehalogenase
LRAEDTLFVDDREDNVAGAQSVGMGAVVFTDAATLRADLARYGILA